MASPSSAPPPSRSRPPARRLFAVILDEDFRTATTYGLASIPFTIAINWATTSDTLSATALFLACVAVGYRYQPRPIEPHRAGARAGMSGSLPLLAWVAVETVSTWLDETASLVVASGAALMTVLVLAGVAALVGILGGYAGAWLHRSVRRVSHVPARG